MESSWLGLEGKTVIVTGGASGIGRAIVEEFSKNECNVIIADINLDQSLEKLNNKSKVINIQTDVTDIKSVNNMVKRTLGLFGEIDILVNNAGINIPRLLVDPKNPHGIYEINEEIFNKLMNVNVKGVLLCTQEVVREMIKKGFGTIINISSESGLEGSEGQSVYAATKGAINAFTRSWAKELGKYGIRVVGVAPGILEKTGLRTLEYETALSYTRGITVEELRTGYSKTSTIPLGRVGKLSEVADLVCYLSSNRASYIHGVTYTIGGGKTRG